MNTAQTFISYLRVSTSRQGDSGLGLEAQRAAIETFVNGHQWELLAEYVEVESGGKNTRPELAKALREAKKRKAVLVVGKLDRLSRNLAFIANLLESGVEFRCADLPEATRTMLQLWAVMAEWEREQISTRTKDALQAAKGRGVKLGSPTPGKGSALGVAAQRASADQFAANIRPVIAEIQGAGITSLRGLATALTARGIPTARGGAWDATTVRRAIRRAG
jgi:DNA invertase Pin-like site-specific DNA recombinase